MRKSKENVKELEKPAVVESIQTGNLALIVNPRDPKNAVLRTHSMVGAVTPTEIEELRNDFARLVASPGFVQWKQKYTASTRKGNSSRSAALKAVWKERKANDRKKSIASAKTVLELKKTVSKAIREIKGGGKVPGGYGKAGKTTPKPHSVHSTGRPKPVSGVGEPVALLG